MDTVSAAFTVIALIGVTPVTIIAISGIIQRRRARRQAAMMERFWASFDWTSSR